jgi:hypothetical protein
VVLAGNAAAAAQSPGAVIPPYTSVITVGQARAVPGAEVRVPLTCAGPSAIGALEFDIDLDARAVQIEGVEAGLGWPGALVEWRIPAPGRLRIVAGGATPAAAQGELLVLTARLLPAGPATSRITIAAGRLWDHAAGFDLRLQAVPGDVTRDRWAWTATRLVVTGIAALALLAAGGLLAWVFRRRRRRASPALPTADDDGTTTICTKCGAAAGGGAKACPSCGAKL